MGWVQHTDAALKEELLTAIYTMSYNLSRTKTLSRSASAHGLWAPHCAPAVLSHAKGCRKNPNSKACPNTRILFFVCQIEVQFIVLEYLHPIDLLQLCRVSENMRSTIMNPQAVGVWKTIFDSHPTLPTPRNIPHSTWAFILYRRGICDLSGCNIVYTYSIWLQASLVV